MKLNGRIILKHFRRSIWWGIKCAIGFVIIYQIIFAISFRFTPGADEHFYVSNNTRIAYIAGDIHRMIIEYPLALGVKAMQMPFDDQYLTLLIYVPYIVSIQYCLVGCIVGLFLSLRKSKKERI